MAKRLPNYDDGNRQAAREILADPDRYQGLCLVWAKAWTERHGFRPLPVDPAPDGRQMAETKEE